MILFGLIALATAASQAYSDFRVTDSEARQITSAEYERCMSRSLHNEEAVQCIGDDLPYRIGQSIERSDANATSKRPTSVATRPGWSVQRGKCWGPHALRTGRSSVRDWRADPPDSLAAPPHASL